MNFKSILMVALFILSLGGIAKADEACNAQLAAKDAVIQQLTQLLAARSSTEVTVSHKYTCQGVCMLNLIGTGWSHPGRTVYVEESSEGTTDQEAINNLYKNCQQDLKAQLANLSDVEVNKQQSSISGVVPVAKFNNATDNLEFVQYFHKVLDPRMYCRRN